MLDFATALARLLDFARAPQTVEHIALAEAGGRVLARDLIAPLSVPGFDNSAMDGYALNVPDFAASSEGFVLVQRIAAGETGQPLAAGEAARIFTGAPVPPGCNAVVMQECCEVAEGRVRLAGKLRPGQHIRLRGEDIQAGSVVLQSSTLLTPQAIGLAASMGFATLPVYAPLRVGVISTGSELVEPGELLAPGQIYNSNRYTLLALLRQAGVVAIDLGKVVDNYDATLNALDAASARCDIVITTGGVSVGEEDHVKPAVQALGTLDLWKIAIKPGKPFAFGRIHDTDLIGLPGNPVSAMVTYLVLVLPYLKKRSGLASVTPPRLALKAAFTWGKPGERREFLRARLNAAGEVELYPQQGSAVLSSLVFADGLVDLMPGTVVAPGDTVQYLPMSELR